MWWIDELPAPKHSNDRYGLNTYMLNGFNKVVRYYPYYEMGFKLTKDLLLKNVSMLLLSL